MFVVVVELRSVSEWVILHLWYLNVMIFLQFFLVLFLFCFFHFTQLVSVSYKSAIDDMMSLVEYNFLFQVRLRHVTLLLRLCRVFISVFLLLFMNAFRSFIERWLRVYSSSIVVFAILVSYHVPSHSSVHLHTFSLFQFKHLDLV